MITLRYNFNQEQPLSAFSFPGGERHINVNHEGQVYVEVCADLHTPQDVLDLLLVDNAFRHVKGYLDKKLVLKYLPYARQDRVAVPGEAHSLQMMCGLISGMQWDDIYVWDVHSDVAKALLPPGTHFISQTELLVATVDTSDVDFLVSPDAGAEKKVYESSKLLNIPVVTAYKTRDPKTGQLSNPKVVTDFDLKGKNLLITDDICDGGFTFIQLAKKLREEYQPARIDLYVTHGIFSKGLEVFEGLIDNVYCANNFLKKD